jgi:hypothetical protein
MNVRKRAIKKKAPRMYIREALNTVHCLLTTGRPMYLLPRSSGISTAHQSEYRFARSWPGV